VRALRTVDTMGGPPKSGTARGVDLAAMDDITRAAIDECGARVDRTQVLAAWEEALSAAAWTAPPVWLHGDLQSGNLLVRDGRLSGVIDLAGWASATRPSISCPPGSCSTVRHVPRSRPLWAAFPTPGPGRGWALLTALIGLPYHWQTVPEFVAQSRRKIDRVLADGRRTVVAKDDAAGADASARRSARRRTGSQG